MSKRRATIGEDADVIFRSGLLYGVVCTTLRNRKEIERRVNAEHPSGTRAGWRISTKRIEGKRSPVPCLDDATRRHYLMEC